MAATLDISTTIGKLRFLAGDTDLTAPNFQDADLQGFLDMNDQSLYLAAAQALESLAATVANNLTDVVLGSLQIDETSKADALRKSAERYRDLEYNTPAFGIIEENLSGFNELTLIRNYIMRTQA